MNLELSPDASGTFELASGRPFIQRRLRRKLVRALRNQAESQNFSLEQINPAQSSLFDNFSPDDIKAQTKEVISKKREHIKARIDDVLSLPEDERGPAIRNEITSRIQNNEGLQALKEQRSDGIISFKPMMATPEEWEAIKTKITDLITTKREEANSLVEEYSPLPEDERISALRNKLSSRIEGADLNPIIMTLTGNDDSFFAQMGRQQAAGVF